MSPTHLSPSDALEAHFILGAQTSVAMHFGTFQMGDDSQTEAVDLLSAAIAETNMQQTQFLILNFGEGREVLLIRSSSSTEHKT